MKSVFLALAPGLACALLGFVVEVGPYLVKNGKAFMQRRASVDSCETSSKTSQTSVQQ